MAVETDGLKISYKLRKKGFQVKIDSNLFTITYPHEVWKSFPKKIKKHIVENFLFLATSPLPAVIKKDKIYYDMNSPVMKTFFLRPIFQYLPFCAEEYSKDFFSLFKRYFNTQYYFKSYELNGYKYVAPIKERAVVLFTFGKDSFLSYAIAEEIGLNPVGIYVEEPDIRYIDRETGDIENIYENKHKEILIKKFKSEFNKTIYRITNTLGLIRYSDYYNLLEAELCWGTQLTEYSLLSLPFNHYFKAKYLIYGNEASCTGFFLNNDGFLINPVFDQSHEWNIELSKLLKLLTKKISTIALIEPLHELAITRILHYRYPQYAKYQMSCFADSNTAEYSRWCHNCSKCARNYVFLKANNINPKKVGLKENMFTKEKISLYSIFGLGKGLKPYDMSGLGRDEQLYAFYLAYKNGAKGYLISLFKRKFLEEAQAREKELHDTYFGIHESITIPKYLKNKVLNIFREELSKV